MTLVSPLRQEQVEHSVPCQVIGKDWQCTRERQQLPQDIADKLQEEVGVHPFKCSTLAATLLAEPLYLKALQLQRPQRGPAYLLSKVVAHPHRHHAKQSHAREVHSTLLLSSGFVVLLLCVSTVIQQKNILLSPVGPWKNAY